jgi:hypothetical protein
MGDDKLQAAGYPYAEITVRDLVTGDTIAIKALPSFHSPAAKGTPTGQQRLFPVATVLAGKRTPTRA